MSTSDTLTLVQTLFAVLTSALLIWYIMVTHKLQRQAVEQSRLQKEQLEVAKQELSQALFRERALLVPYIRWRGGSSGPNEEKWEFENVGADVCNVRWSASKNLGVQYEPRHMIRTFDQGSIQVYNDLQQIEYPLRFSLAFTNRFGEAGTRDFEIAGPGTEPKEVQPYQA
jgi:hypothetical protein